MRSARFLVIFTCMMAAVNFTSADTIRGINIDFVTIGNAGNAGDTTYEAHPQGCGAVSSSYRIGKYEVTNAQWNAFTTTAGAPTGNDGGYSYNSSYTNTQYPTNRVSWYEAAQFCNYLTSGDKSKGAYQFSGNNTNPGSFQGIDRVSSISIYGTTYVLPTQDEWYKAAYFKPDASGYSFFTNGTNTAPVSGVQANWNGGRPWDVGTGTQEQNGTFDMIGNVFEWHETLISGSLRGYRGGAYWSYTDFSSLSSAASRSNNPYYENTDVGFRIAEIPEPATLLLLGLGGLVLRKKH